MNTKHLLTIVIFICLIFGFVTVGAQEQPPPILPEPTSCNCIEHPLGELPTGLFPFPTPTPIIYDTPVPTSTPIPPVYYPAPTATVETYPGYYPSAPTLHDFIQAVIEYFRAWKLQFIQ